MVDWGKLYESGRCKQIGVPWNEKEKNAVYILKIPADFVRRGCLTKDEYKKTLISDKGIVEKTGKVPLTQLRKEQLYQLCQKEGVNVTPEATKPTLIDELKASGYPASIPISDIPKA